MKTQKPFFLSVLILLAALIGAQAFTWHVDAKGLPGAGGTAPADALPSLQAAIDRADDGDLILVAEGEYAPVSVASARTLTIRSTDGAENTFLAGDGKTRCATFADEMGDAAWNVTLEGFTLAGGVDVSELGGGGVFGGNLLNCVLRDNAAIRGGAASGSRLENCLLTANAASLLGGGAFDSELVNCTVAGNHADGTGGGVCGCGLANCIVWANDSPDGMDAAGSFAVYSCTTPLLDGEGNFEEDPLFVNAETGDWRVSSGSPCLNAGDGGFCASATDFAGRERIAGAAVDLGAYEGAPAPAAKSRDASKKTARKVTIAFRPNGGTCDTATKAFRVGAKYSNLPLPVRRGYLFTGWHTSPNGGTRITTNTVVSASHGNFYAHWARTVAIVFDPNGGTCGTARKAFRVGVKYPTLPRPTRRGYLFTGWYTAAKGGTRITTNTVATLSRKKLYAHWFLAIKFSFNPNGGTCSVKTKTYGHFRTYGSFPVPTRSNHAFSGWHTPDGKLVKTNYTVTAARTNLVAHWFKNLSVHPVGDSMTYGVRTRNNPLLNGASSSAVAKISNQGWRGYLKETLVPWGKDKKRAVVFLGTHPQSSCAGNVPHDGYPGENASSYARNHPSACQVKADVQIVFLGMNDAISISRKDDPYNYIGSLEDGYDRVLSSLHAGSTTPLTILITEPQVTSLISKHNPLYKAPAINNVIVHIINPYVRSRQEAKVKILDIESLYSNASYTDDGFHLSVEGNKVVSSRLANLIKGFWKGK